MLGALSLAGLVAVMTIEGGTDTAAFLAFVEHVLLPKLKPGDIVVVDNVGAHKPTAVRELIEAAGAHLVFLRPARRTSIQSRSAGANSRTCSKLLAPRSRDDLDFAIGESMRRIPPNDVAGSLRHAGYSCRSS